MATRAASAAGVAGAHRGSGEACFSCPTTRYNIKPAPRALPGMPSLSVFSLALLESIYRDSLALSVEQ